jgi:hypothetical protein
MEKKTCNSCGKTWIIERFDGHLCIALPKKRTRKPRAASQPGGTKPAESKTEANDKGVPLVSFQRIS